MVNNNILENISEIKKLKGYSNEDVFRILNEFDGGADKPDEIKPDSIPEVKTDGKEADETSENDKPDKPIDKIDMKKLISSEVQLEVKRQLKVKRGSPPEMREPKPGEDFVKNTIRKNLFEIIV